MAAIGRVRQTIQAVSAWLRPVEDDLAEQYLSAAEMTLFMTMPRSDRQHHLRVLKRVLASGATDAPLLVAALLHDVGKTRVRFTILDRIIAVLVKRFLPHQFVQWSQGEAHGWRKALVVSAQHPAWGTEMLAAIQSDEQAITLVRHHQDSSDTVAPELQPLLRILQAADDAS